MTDIEKRLTICFGCFENWAKAVVPQRQLGIAMYAAATYAVLLGLYAKLGCLP